mmetsp:Transcript_60092/g.71483  ORF Transcript_60092/g.71483 Transcript_60092/m.71483 type:complete len:109 (+) Transcript_60092:338-664(+)
MPDAANPPNTTTYNNSNLAPAEQFFRHTEGIQRCTKDENDDRLCTALSCDATKLLSTRKQDEDKEDTTKKHNASESPSSPIGIADFPLMMSPISLTCQRRQPLPNSTY